MSTNANSSQPTSWVLIVFVIGMSIWFFKGCSDRTKERDLEMKGIGMLEARGISTDILPQDAGKDYYLMVNDDGARQYTSEDIKYLVGSFIAYQRGFSMLRDKGLSESDIRKIPDQRITDAIRQSDPQKAIDDLARNPPRREEREY